MAKKIIVIGGGAAGMLASLFAAQAGARVTLLERNEKLGKKLYITGKGRCNLTNACEKEEFQRQVLRNPRFLYASLAVLDNFGMMDLMENLGVPLKVERGQRVFPVSDHASDVGRALEKALRTAGVDIRLNTRAASLLEKDGRCRGVRLFNGAELPADGVIVCTGGVSYPATGSTGDGHRMARDAGLAVTPLLPGLTSLHTGEAWPGELAGLSLKNVALRAYAGKKRIYAQQGEMLFTHTGISGPLVLTLSSLLPQELSQVRLSIDLKPALDDGALDARLLREVGQNPRRSVSSIMDTLCPHSMGQTILVLGEIPPGLPACEITHAQRARIRGLLKDLPLTVRSLGSFEEAIITRGGVSVKEINPSTLESRKLPGAYFAGEVLDVDAVTGGFNLQIAFSTGALAGKSAAQAEA